MSVENRLSIISSIEKEMSTKIVCYLTGDRPGMQTQIGSDVVLRFRRHLEGIGEVDNISLFIYSRGGDTNVPWRLVNLLREYCKKLNVLIPYCAHSAATLISLGADKIYMGKMSELSPIDPSVANPFNPPDPMNQMAKVPISVEDVNSYKHLAKRFGVQEDNHEGNVQVFLELAKTVNPLALGNVERSYNQIRKLAESLLKLHVRDASPDVEQKQKQIVATLTEHLYSHLHMINRREAKQLGLDVEYVNNSLDKKLWELFSDYGEEMLLNQPFNAQQELADRPAVRIELKRAFVESLVCTDTFISAGLISRLSQGPIALPQGVQLPPGMMGQMPITVQIDREGWVLAR